MVFTNESIKKAKELIREVVDLSDKDIPELAMRYVKEKKKELVRINLPVQERGDRSFFMAGSPGAGKTEFAKTSFDEEINIIEADRIRKTMPYYKGYNSFLFQRASSKAVNILLEHCFKLHLSFVLDGNFAILKNQQENIARCLKRDYQVTILFVYRSPKQALEFTEIREEKEGRKISEKVFIDKSLGAIETTKHFIGYNTRINVNFVDMERDEIINDISVEDFEKRTNPLKDFCHVRIP